MDNPNINRRRNKIAWIALAVGLVAIAFTMGSHIGDRRAMGLGMHSRPVVVQAVPAAPVAPSPPDAVPGPQGFQQGQRGFERGPMGFGREDRGFQQREFEVHSFRGGSGSGPLGFLEQLLKIAVLGFSLFLLVQVWRDRRGGNGGSSNGGSSNGGNGGSSNGGTQSSPRTNPEEPPYTGMTTNL
jgi:hypothetical protein